MTTVIAGREVKVGDPWFDDGNIILVTHDEPTAFLLHRGVLSRHSEMFRDMFEVGHPVQEHEDAASASQVVVMYDRPADLSSLVKVLYDGVPTNPNHPNEFFQLAGVLRLATKYCAQRIRIQTIRAITTVWSHTLEGHDIFTRKALTEPFINDFSFPYIHPLHVLNLARETDVEVFVPPALYFLSVYPLATIISGDHPKLAVKHPSRPSSTLSPADLELYTLMYQHRLEIGVEFLRKTCTRWTYGRQTCSDPECPKGFNKLLSRLQRSWNTRTATIYFMHQVKEEVMGMPKICGPCRKDFFAEVDELRAKVWEELPGVVGLPTWEDLVKRDLE